MISRIKSFHPFLNLKCWTSHNNLFASATKRCHIVFIINYFGNKQLQNPLENKTHLFWTNIHHVVINLNNKSIHHTLLPYFWTFFPCLWNNMCISKLTTNNPSSNASNGTLPPTISSNQMLIVKILLFVKTPKTICLNDSTMVTNFFTYMIINYTIRGIKDAQTN